MRAPTKGCRLDAWDEYLDKEKWFEAIGEASYDVNASIYDEYRLDEPLPWDGINLRVGKPFLVEEYKRASRLLLTGRCTDECAHLCAACTPSNKVVDAKRLVSIEYPKPQDRPSPLSYVQALVTYRRAFPATLISHINTMRNVEMALQRANLQVQFTQGYNPTPKLEFVIRFRLNNRRSGNPLVELVDDPSVTESVVKETLQKNLKKALRSRASCFCPKERSDTLPAPRRQPL